MQKFDPIDLDRLLPDYYKAEKGRLSELLQQFSDGGQIDYADFYLSNPPKDHFLNGDLVKEIRCPLFDSNRAEYVKVYPHALILSNTCDLFSENERSLNIKEAIFAPAMELQDYLKEYSIDDPQKESFLHALRRQEFTNLFYLPTGAEEDAKSEYIVRFDKLFWFPTEELLSYLENIEINRVCSLSKIAHYLLVTKITWHLARLPEEPDRYM